jgi:hypothetical protein
MPASSEGGTGVVSKMEECLEEKRDSMRLITGKGVVALERGTSERDEVSYVDIFNRCLVFLFLGGGRERALRSRIGVKTGWGSEQGLGNGNTWTAFEEQREYHHSEKLVISA